MRRLYTSPDSTPRTGGAVYTIQAVIEDIPENNGLYARYGVRGIPHFVLISPEGKVVDSWSGYAKGWLKLKIKGSMAPKQPMRMPIANIPKIKGLEAPQPADAYRMERRSQTGASSAEENRKNGGADHLSGGVDRLGYGTSRACTVYSKLLDSVGQSDFFDVGQGGELSASAQ